MINDQANVLLVRKKYEIVWSINQILEKKDMSEAAGKESMIHWIVKLDISALSLYQRDVYSSKKNSLLLCNCRYWQQ